MENRASEPLEPTRPPEIDEELSASAANAVDQWRNYQQAYGAYQQQCIAYQNYVQQSQFAQTVEQQQMIYDQYLEQHRQYQYHLQQYEQYKMQKTASSGYGSQSWQAPMVHFAGPNHAPPNVQPPLTQDVQPSSVVPVNGNQVPPTAGHPPATGNTKRGRDPKLKQKGQEKKSELHTKTIIYVNPDDEKMLPEDLKALFKDFHCNLCRTRMNSHISANIHYQSKAHEKKIIQWLKEYCTETGTPMPVRARHLPELASDVTDIGKSVFHCEACDLPLTSIQHANQHYTGKRHWLVVNGKKVPSGNGHYNAEGKWIRSTNIVTEVTSPTVPGSAPKRPIAAEPNGESKRARLAPPPNPPHMLLAKVLPPVAVGESGPVNGVATSKTPAPGAAVITINVESGEDIIQAAQTVHPPEVATTSVPAASEPAPENGGTTLEQEIRKKEGLDCVDDTGTFCLICETSVTSRSEMLMHLKGAKHLKKARMMGMVVRTTPFNATDTILKSLSKPARQTDWSLYRMPSGRFYCKTCNLIVADEKLFGQHWYGKKHKLKLRQEQAAQQKGRTPSTPSTSATSDSTTTESLFALDDHDVGVDASGSIESANVGSELVQAPSDVGPALEQANTPKPMGKRGRRPFFFNRKGRYNKPRQMFPVPNSAGMS